MRKTTQGVILMLALCFGLASGCSGGVAERDGPPRFSAPAETGAPVQESGEPSAAPGGSGGETLSDEQPDSDEVSTPFRKTETVPTAPGGRLAVLEAMPYYGDPARCVMTAEQATAYAQLLEDGIAGKVPEGESHYDRALPDVLYWDQPYLVRGYSLEYYETDRALAILGDFAGDGHPYLCVLSSRNEETGFDLYYGTDGSARFVFGDEVYRGRRSTSFSVESDGIMTITTGGSNGAADHSWEIYGLSGGETVTLYGYHGYMDYEAGLFHAVYSVNGEVMDLTYPEEMTEEDLARQREDRGIPDPPEEQPGQELRPISLREMIGLLSQYAAGAATEKPGK